MTTPHAFVDALLQFSARPDCRADYAARQALVTEHRHGLAVTLLALNATGFGVSGPAHPNPPESCDLCGRDLSSTSPFFMDGQTARTSTVSRVDPMSGDATQEEHPTWADMCADCYLREGRGVGWGIGQLYAPEPQRDGSVAWVLIGGGDPSGQVAPTEPWE